MCRRAWEIVVHLVVKTCVKQFLVQILVVVANIQMRILKTEVEKARHVPASNILISSK